MKYPVFKLGGIDDQCKAFVHLHSLGPQWKFDGDYNYIDALDDLIKGDGSGHFYLYLEHHNKKFSFISEAPKNTDKYMLTNSLKHFILISKKILN